MRYKNGDRFIIEIEQVTSKKCYSEFNEPTTTDIYHIKGFNSLVFDGYGLDRLTRIDNYEKEKPYWKGYQDGYKDGKKNYDPTEIIPPADGEVYINDKNAVLMSYATLRDFVHDVESGRGKEICQTMGNALYRLYRFKEMTLMERE